MWLISIHSDIPSLALEPASKHLNFGLKFTPPIYNFILLSRPPLVPQHPARLKGCGDLGYKCYDFSPAALDHKMNWRQRSTSWWRRTLINRCSYLTDSGFSFIFLQHASLVGPEPCPTAGECYEHLSALIHIPRTKHILLVNLWFYPYISVELRIKSSQISSACVGLWSHLSYDSLWLSYAGAYGDIK